MNCSFWGQRYVFFYKYFGLRKKLDLISIEDRGLFNFLILLRILLQDFVVWKVKNR